MKKDGKELTSLGGYYHIIGYERKKMVYRSEKDKDGRYEFYIKTKDGEFIRVYQYGDRYDTDSVKETIIDKLPANIRKEIEDIRKWYAEVEDGRHKEYRSESEYLQDYRMVRGTIDGFCTALYLAGVVKNRWAVENYMLMDAE